MDNHDINLYLKELVESSLNNINGALVLRKNGQLVNSILPEEIDHDKISLIGTILVGSSQRACDELNRGNLKHIMVGGDFGKIIFISHGNDEFLGALVPFEASYDDVLKELEMVDVLIS